MFLLSLICEVKAYGESLGPKLLLLRTDNQDLGFVNIYGDEPNIKLSLKEVAALLKLDIQFDIANQNAEGYNLDNIFLLNCKLGIAVVDNKVEHFDKALIDCNDKDIYIDKTLLSNVLSTNFMLNKTDGSVYVEHSLPQIIDPTQIPEKIKEFKIATVDAVEDLLSTNFEAQNNLEREDVINDKLLLVIAKGKTKTNLGFVNSNEYRAGVMLPLKAIAKLLNLNIKVDPLNKTANGWIVRENNIFSLNGNLGTATVNGKKENFEQELVIYADDDIYIDSTLLSTLLPITFRLNRSENSLYIAPSSNLSDNDKQTIASNWLKPQQNHDLISEDNAESQSTIEKPLQGQALDNSESSKASSSAVKEKLMLIDGHVLSPEDGIVVQPMLKDNDLDEMIEIYQYKQLYFIPLGKITKLLSLAITVDIAHGQANGFIIKENRKFHLDIKNSSINVKDKQSNFEPNYVQANHEDIFVESKLLATWLPLEFQVNKRLMVLKILSKEILPAELLMSRQNNWNKIKDTTKKVKKIYQEYKTPYQLFSMPFVDISLNNNFSRINNKIKDLPNFNARASGDLGYMTSNSFASAAAGKLTSLRINAERRDLKSTLLGPLKASAFAVGDITSLDVPIVSSGGSGRGFSLTNRPLNSPSQFDLTQFVGTANPGWQVELYRNGLLVGFKQVGTDGRYEFNNVDVLYGNNTFRLIFYGPEGQKYEEVKTILANESLLQKGDFNYQLSIDDASKTLFGIDERSKPNADLQGLRLVTGFDYGLSKSLTVGHNFVKLPLKDEGNHHYSVTSIRTNVIKKVLIGGDVAYDIDNKGYATKVAALTSFKDVNIRLDRRDYHNFITSDQHDNSGQKPTNTLLSRSEIDLDSQLPIFTGIGVGSNFKIENYTSKLVTTIYASRINGSFLGMNFNNTISSINSRLGVNNQRTLQGNIGLNGSYKNVFIRLGSDYNLPKFAFANINLSLQKYFSEQTSLLIQYNKNLYLTKDTDISASLSHEFKKFRLGVKVDLLNKKDFAITTNISFALGREPRHKKLYVSKDNLSSTGSISARAFVDKNGNGIFDANEELIKKVSFKINNNVVKKTEDGLAFINGLSPNRSSDVIIEDDLLEDPFLSAANPGYSVVPRPGSVTMIDFPLIEGSEINGVITSIVNNEVKGVGRADVELVNDKGEVVRKIRAEFDGFYLLNKVVAGNYILRISPEFLKKIGGTADERHIEITKDGKFYDDIDFVVKKK